MNELATFGVYAELPARGLAIPDDVSVLGIVTSPGVGTLSYPPLTTMHSPGAELGRLAVDRLLTQLDPGRAARPQSTHSLRSRAGDEPWSSPDRAATHRRVRDPPDPGHLTRKDTQ